MMYLCNWFQVKPLQVQENMRSDKILSWEKMVHRITCKRKHQLKIYEKVSQLQVTINTKAHYQEFLILSQRDTKIKSCRRVGFALDLEATIRNIKLHKIGREDQSLKWRYAIELAKLKREVTSQHLVLHHIANLKKIWRIRPIERLRLPLVSEHHRRERSR